MPAPLGISVNYDQIVHRRKAQLPSGARKSTRGACLHVAAKSHFEYPLDYHGGFWMAVAWLIAAAIMAITIIGIPWARAAFNIANYTLLPFGRVALSREEVRGYEDLGTGPLGTIGNLIWLLLAGWWLALGHIITAIGLAITVIGIPFAWAHLKFVPISLWPIGKMIVSSEEAEKLRSGRRI